MILCVPARAMGPGELSSSNLPPKQMLRCAPGFLATRAPGNHLLRCVASHPASGEVFGISARLTCPIISDLRVCRRVAEVPVEDASKARGGRLVMSLVTSREQNRVMDRASRIESSGSWTVCGTARRGREKGVWGVERACHTGQHRSLQSVCVTQKIGADLGSGVLSRYATRTV
jgi:hypothetical protein